MYFALTADGVEVVKNVSYTPVILKVLNLPAELRTMMANIRMVAVLPPGVVDYNSVLRPIAADFARHMQKGGTPIITRHPRTNMLLHLFVHLTYTLNDVRGVPTVTCNHHAPCYIGSCVFCKVRGIRRHDRTVLPAAVRGATDVDLRKRYQHEFRHDETLSVLADENRPHKRRKSDAINAGRRAQGPFASKAAAKRGTAAEAFTNVSVFSELLPYHDVTKHNFYDLAHTFANYMKACCALMANRTKKEGSKVQFGPKQRTYEMETLKRFHYLDVPVPQKEAAGYYISTPSVLK